MMGDQTDENSSPGCGEATAVSTVRRWNSVRQPHQCGGCRFDFGKGTNIKRIIVAVILVVAACGGNGGSAGTSDDTASGTNDTEASTGGSETESSDPGSSGSGDADSESDAVGDGTRIFVSTQIGIDIVDLAAEDQEAFAEGYDSAYGLAVAQGHLWFADAANSLVSLDTSSGDEQGKVALPGQFAGLAVTDEMAWVIAGLIGADSQLVGIERDGMVVRGSALPPEFSYYSLVAAAGDDVWVEGGDIESSTTVRKVDPASVTVGEPVDTGVIADSMVMGSGALWVGGTKPIGPDGSTGPLSAIAKLDASTGASLDLFEIGGFGDDEVVLEVAFGYLWATKGLEAVLIKFDPASGEELDRVEVGSGAAGIPYPILLTSDAVWVVNSTDNQALSFDPETMEFVSGINLPTFAGAFAFVP